MFARITFALAMFLVVGCAANHSKNRIVDNQVEVQSSTPMIQAATTQNADAENHAVETLNKIRKGDDAESSAEITINSVRATGDKLRQAGSIQSQADSDVASLKKQLKSTQDDLQKSLDENEELKAENEEYKNGQGKTIGQFLAWIGGIGIVVSVGAGFAAAMFMPKLKLFAVGVGIASLFLIAIGFAAERYSRPLAIGGMILISASIIGGAAYLISEIIKTRRDAKSIIKSVDKAEETVETFNVTPEAKKVMEREQTPGAVRLVQEAKAEVKADESKKSKAKSGSSP